MSDVKKEVERVFPKDQFRIKVFQLDSVGISVLADDDGEGFPAQPGSLIRAATDAKRRGANYLTYVMVNELNGTFVTSAVAECSKHDQPRRKLGWQKAMGRAIHNYLNQYNGVSFN